MKRMNRALLATTEGDWAVATENLSAILEKDSDNYGVHFSPFFGGWCIDRSFLYRL